MTRTAADAGPRRALRNTVLAPLLEPSAGLPDLFASRPFRGLYFARLLSSLGDACGAIAVPFAVLTATGSVTGVGLAIAMRVLPTPLLVLLAGVAAERLSRVGIMVASDLLRLVSQGLFALLVLSGQASLWQILVLQACTGAGHTFFMPASFGLMPRTTTAELLPHANAVQFLSFGFSAVFGPALGGMFVVAFDPGVALAVDAATFGASAVLLLALRSLAPSRAVSRSPARGLVEGWRALTARRWIWLGITQNALIGFIYFACFNVLGPAVAVVSPGGAAGWAVVVSAAGMGSVAGSAVMVTVRARRPLLVAFAGLAAMAPLVALLAIPAPVVVLAAAALLAGLAIQAFNTVWSGLLQEHLASDLRSCVNNYDWLGSLALRPIGFAVIGPVAALFGRPATLAAAAVLMALLAAAPLAFREVRNLPLKRSPGTREVEFPHVS